MELRTYWKVLLRRWWLIVVPVAVVALYTAVTYAPPAPVYQVTMRFAAGTTPAGLSEAYDRYYPWLTSEYIAAGLADIARTQAFAEAISERLAGQEMEVPPDAIQPRIVSDHVQSILVIYLSWPDAEQSVPVAQAIAAELSNSGASYFPQLDGVEPAARLLDTPAPALAAPGLRTQLMGPAIKIGLAAGIGVALAFLWHYVDPTVREARELEKMGLPVLAKIPKK